MTKSGEEKTGRSSSAALRRPGQGRPYAPEEYVEKKPSGAVVTVTKAPRTYGSTASSSRGLRAARRRPRRKHTGPTASPGREGRQGLPGDEQRRLRQRPLRPEGDARTAATSILIEGNVIFDNGTETHDHGIYMPADDVTINGNIIFESAGYGIHAYTAPKRLVITRNVCFANKAGGIILAPAASARSSTTSAPTTCAASSTSAVDAPATSSRITSSPSIVRTAPTTTAAGN